MPVPLSVSSSLGEEGGEGSRLVPTIPLHKASPREPWTREASLLTVKTARRTACPHGLPAAVLEAASPGLQEELGRQPGSVLLPPELGWHLEGTFLLLGLHQVLPLSSHTGARASPTPARAGLWKGHGGDTGADRFTSARCGVWYLPSEHLALAAVRNMTLRLMELRHSCSSCRHH